MNKSRQSKWRFNRQVDLSFLLQLILLAGLILGSWVNLQRQLDLLQHDMDLLLQSSAKFQEKLEELTAEKIAHEYRLRTVEKELAKAE